jgi:hypothetical protein
MKMKKKLLTLLASLVLTGPAWAEWVRVGQSEIGYKYIDPATIRKDGNLVRVWSLTNLKQRHKDGELSSRSRIEYDCKQERLKFLSMTEHSGPMASGTELRSAIGDGQWSDIPPGSLSETVLKIVCAK